MALNSFAPDDEQDDDPIAQAQQLDSEAAQDDQDERQEATNEQLSARGKSPALDFSASAVPVKAPAARGGARKPAPALDFSSGADPIKVPTSPPLPTSRPPQADLFNGMAPADVPMPTPRPDSAPQAAATPFSQQQSVSNSSIDLIPGAEGMPLGPAVAGSSSPQPGVLEMTAKAMQRGGAEGIRDSIDAFKAWDAKKAENDPTYLGKMLQTPISQGWKDPTWWGVQMGYGLAKSAPSLAAGLAGGATGTAVGGPAVGVAGGVAGFGLGSAIQAIAPAYAQARQEGLTHEQAVDRAWKETGISAAFGAGMGLVGAGPAAQTVKGAIGKALAEIFSFSVLGVGEAESRRMVEGKQPLTPEEIAQTAALSAVPGATIIGGHAAVRAARGEGAFVRQPPPRSAPDEIRDFLNPGAKTRADIDEFIQKRDAGWTYNDKTGEWTPPAGEPSTAETPQPSADSAARTPPESEETPPSPVVSAAERRTLRKKGYTDDQIDAMGRDEAEAELGEAAEQRVEPTEPAQPEQEISPTDNNLSAEPKPDFSDQGVPAQGAGTRSSPAKVNDAIDVARAGQQVNTEPTEAQQEAGNYKKGHVRFAGLPVTIENPKGSIRTGTNPDGSPWQVQMPAAYGYIKRSKAKDGDQVDVYLGPQHDAPHAFIVDQYDPATAKFDEHKIMLGFPDQTSATQAYDAAFSDQSGVHRRGAVTPVTIPDLKAWLKSPKTTTPFQPKDFGFSPAGVDPIDLKRASEIVRQTGAEPHDAFEQATMEGALADGTVTPAEMDAYYGKGAADEISGDRSSGDVETSPGAGQDQEGQQLPRAGETGQSRPDQTGETRGTDQSGQAGEIDKGSQANNTDQTGEGNIAGRPDFSDQADRGLAPARNAEAHEGTDLAKQRAITLPKTMTHAALSDLHKKLKAASDAEKSEVGRWVDEQYASFEKKGKKIERACREQGSGFSIP